MPSFPAVTAQRYLLTLGSRGFYWLSLRRPDA